MVLRIILLSLLLCSCKLSFSQFNLLLQRVDSVNSDNPIEKVHLHLDKPYYAAGQTIWFKAYVVDGNSQPAMRSKVLYIDLIDEQQNIHGAIKLPLTAGLAHGDFTLSDTLKEGNFRIRAYTQWMRNFGEQYFFDKVVPIGNSLSSEIITKVSYSYKKEGQKEVTEASIGYTTLEGDPLAEQEISYELKSGLRTLSRGKGKTDERGNLLISFDSESSDRYLRTILLHNNRQQVVKVIPVKAKRDTDIRFFPEGGELVDSIRSKVAFKAIGSDGLGMAVTGYVIDKDSIRVAVINTVHNGMGSFMLTPFSGQTYTALITFSDGSKKRILLPKSKAQGYVLTKIGEDNSNLRMRVIGGRNMHGQLTLVAQAADQVYEVAEVKLNKQYVDISFPVKELPAGIARLTLFDEQNQPVAERLVFIRHDNDQLKLDIKSKSQYFIHEKVNMKLNARDSEGNAATGSFSVSVTDMTRVPVKEEEETTILSNLLLTSELKGYVEKPNYYFLDNSTTRLEHLDNLLLTQGWRRYSWREISELKPTTHTYKPEESIAISGRVMSGSSPVKEGRVTLFNTQAGILVDTLTNNEGRFIFDGLSFPDSMRFAIQARTAKDKNNVKIELDRVPPQVVTKKLNDPDVVVDVNSTMLTYLKDTKQELAELQKQGLLNRTQVLEEVTIRAQRPNQTLEYSSRLGKQPADYVFQGEKLENATTIDEVISGKIPGLTITYNPMMHSATAYLQRNNGIPMRVYLDGFDMGTNLADFLLFNIAGIEVLTRSGTAIYGGNAAGGIIHLTSKRGLTDAQFTASPVPGMVTYQPKGFYLAKEFYSPRYDVPEKKQGYTDLRTTVYWNPSLNSGKELDSSFHFFTADRPGTYRTVIEGLDYRGRLGRAVYIFTIQ